MKHKAVLRRPHLSPGEVTVWLCGNKGYSATIRSTAVNYIPTVTITIWQWDRILQNGDIHYMRFEKHIYTQFVERSQGISNHGFDLILPRCSASSIWSVDYGYHRNGNFLLIKEFTQLLYQSLAVHAVCSTIHYAEGKMITRCLLITNMKMWVMGK